MIGVCPARAAARSRFMESGAAALSGLCERSKGEPAFQYNLQTSISIKAGLGFYPILPPSPIFWLSRCCGCCESSMGIFGVGHVDAIVIERL